MNSVYDIPKPPSLEQDSLMPAAQESPQATQSSVPLQQDSAIISVLENILQNIYLYLLERTKMVCTLLSVSSWYNKSLCFERDRFKVFNSLFPKKPIQSHLNLLGMKNTHKSPSSPNFPRFWKEWKTYELYFDYNCHFLDTAGLRETVKLLKFFKKTNSSSFADKRKAQLSPTGKKLVMFLTTFGAGRDWIM